MNPKQSVPQSEKHPVNQVTGTSKYLALLLFILLPFLGGFIGYQYGLKNSGTLSQTPVPDTEPTVQSEPANTEITINDETDFYSINAVYPVSDLDPSGVMAKYVTNLVTQRQADWQVGGEMYQAEMAVSSEFPDRPPVSYYLDVRYSTSSAPTLDTTSYVFLISENTGGNTGNATVISFTFNPDGQVTIEDMFDFSDDADISLTRTLRAAVVAQYGSETINTDMLDDGLGLAYLQPDGVTFDSEACGCDGFLFLSNFQTFAVSEFGITFSFSKYAIAPSVFSTPAIFLTWQQLQPHLTTTYAAKTATLATISEYFLSADQSQRFITLNSDSPSYELVVDGVVTTGLLNTERGYQDDIDATVYILNYDQPEAEQRLFVRLTASNTTLTPLLTDRTIEVSGTNLLKMQ